MLENFSIVNGTAFDRINQQKYGANKIKQIKWSKQNRANKMGQKYEAMKMEMNK